MKNHIKAGDQRIPYQIVKHRRARRVKISVREGQVRVTIPWYTPKYIGLKFLQSNLDWVTKQLAKAPLKHPLSGDQLNHLKKKTRKLVTDRLDHFNRHYRFTYHRVSIRNQKTRWGSCSSSGTLSFNAKLWLLPPKLSDYIIVHELCHLKQLNHGPKFWALVAKTIPDHKTLRKHLRHLETQHSLL